MDYEGKNRKFKYLLSHVRKSMDLSCTDRCGRIFRRVHLLAERKRVLQCPEGNVVLMGLSLGKGEWTEAIYYLIPISAYMMGAFVSELLPNPIKHHFPIRWDSLLIGIEMLVVLGLGFLPDSAPVQISQVAINFIASMQYNTFRQAEGVPMATTFVTNHTRQIGIGFAKELLHRHSDDKSHRTKWTSHFEMLLFFLVGIVVGTLCCRLLSGKAIWITLIPLGFLLSVLIHADLTTEKDMVDKKPAGH